MIIKYVIMKKRSLLLFAAAAILSVCSCSKTDETDDTTTPQLKERTINAKVVSDNVWTNELSETKSGNSPLLFVCYLFDPTGACVRARGDNMGDNMTVQFQDATTTGVHKLYGVTNLYSNEIPLPSTGTIDMTTTFPLSPNRDISLGCTTFTVLEETMDYNVQVDVEHIMAKLTLNIKFVPSDVIAMSVILPEQGVSFKFDGTIVGNTQSQTFNLVKAEEANENGSYDWSLPETIVLPSETNASSMPIHVVATFRINETTTYDETIETSTSTVCASSTRLKLSTTWETFYNTATININDWTGTVIEDDFEL